ncbi:hypothetical protein D7X98_12210 [bacterium 1XD8-76]|nr:hypothetical protein D7X98_12210 [bacterium 1XD8-76]
MRKEHAYKVFVDIWRLICKYRFQKLDDTEWGSFVSDGERLLQRYKGTDVEYLYRQLLLAVSAVYEQFEKNKMD